MVVIGLAASVSLGQITPTCVSGTFPLNPLVRPTADDNVASDLSVAAGMNRVVVFSNSGVRLMCKAGFLTLNSQADLNGTNVNTVAFTETTSSFTHLITFDPRVIYDGYDGRFWAVAAENDLHIGHPENDQGRLHISLSGAGVTNAEMPQSWSTTYWIKYTGDGPTGAAGPSIDPEDFSDDHFDAGHFPDRPTIAVDRDFLYISVREGTQGHSASEDRMLMIVMCKADLVAGTPTVVTSQFIDTDAETGSAMHVLAVDNTIPDDGTHRVYMVTLPALNVDDTVGVGRQFTSIRVGAFSYYGDAEQPCDATDPEDWVYEHTDDATLDAGEQFIGMDLAAVEAKGAATGVSTGLNAQTPFSLFMNARTRILGDDDRRIWCIHNILPVPATDTDPPPISQLQWYQINLNGWPDSGSPAFDRVERIALNDPYDRPLNVFDGAIDANECEDGANVAVGFTRGAYYNSGTLSWTYAQFWKALYPNGSSPTIAVVATGALQYYDPGNTAWADFAGVAADPDPAHSSRFYGHHMTAHADASGAGTATAEWESWLASWTFGSCNSFAMADFDQDQDVDAGDTASFAAYVEEDNMAADLDESEAIDAMDLIIMLNAVGESP